MAGRAMLLLQLLAIGQPHICNNIYWGPTAVLMHHMVLVLVPTAQDVIREPSGQTIVVLKFFFFLCSSSDPQLVTL
jgi:hypothetical protein